MCQFKCNKHIWLMIHLVDSTHMKIVCRSMRSSTSRWQPKYIEALQDMAGMTNLRLVRKVRSISKQLPVLLSKFGKLVSSGCYIKDIIELG